VDNGGHFRTAVDNQWTASGHLIMTITIESIRKDIEGYQERIAKAREQINLLPAEYLPYQDHRKKEKQRRDCVAEVRHCEQLILYALEGIETRRAEACE